jgi:hypothetical protein
LHPFKLCAAGPPPPSSMWPAPLTPSPSPPPPSTLYAAKPLSPHFTPTHTHTHLCSCCDEVASQHSPRVSLKCAQAGTVHHTPQLQQTVTRTTQQHLRGHKQQPHNTQHTVSFKWPDALDISASHPLPADMHAVALLSSSCVQVACWWVQHHGDYGCSHVCR